MTQSESPEENVGSMKRKVLRHAHAAVVDVGRQVDEVVAVCRLVHVLLKKLVGREVRRLLADPEVRVHDVGHVRHSNGRVKIRFSNEKFGTSH